MHDALLRSDSSLPGGAAHALPYPPETAQRCGARIAYVVLSSYSWVANLIGGDGFVFPFPVCIFCDVHQSSVRFVRQENFAS
jgi:hypothetical protein